MVIIVAKFNFAATLLMVFHCLVVQSLFTSTTTVPIPGIKNEAISPFRNVSDGNMSNSATIGLSSERDTVRAVPKSKGLKPFNTKVLNRHVDLMNDVNLDHSNTLLNATQGPVGVTSNTNSSPMKSSALPCNEHDFNYEWIDDYSNTETMICNELEMNINSSMCMYWQYTYSSCRTLCRLECDALTANDYIYRAKTLKQFSNTIVDLQTTVSSLNINMSETCSFVNESVNSRVLHHDLSSATLANIMSMCNSTQTLCLSTAFIANIHSYTISCKCPQGPLAICSRSLVQQNTIDCSFLCPCEESTFSDGVTTTITHPGC